MPRGIRFAATACIILSAVVGFLAASETWGLFRLDELGEEAWPLPSENPSAQKALDEGWAEYRQHTIAAINGMREARALTLVGLSLACALTFGLPRERVRRLLVGAAVAAGVLRTVDGAQLAVISQRQGAAMQKVLAALHLFPWGAGLTMGFAIFQTFVIAGGFLLASQYFRSERVKRIIAFRDTHPE
jgi:hypothetical protein